MLRRLFNNRLTRRLATALEADHNRLLGTNHTMRLAHWLNRIANRRYQGHRQHLYAGHLDELFAENGPASRPPLRMIDGWALDESRSLPHLDRLLADSQEIIKERGGVARRGGDRAFFQQIVNDDALARFPSILDFATSTDVLRTVTDYMGIIPTLSVAKPLGVRLNESWQAYAGLSHGRYQESQLFHCDYHDMPMVYIIVALCDITLRHGPFCFLPAAASRRAAATLGYGQRGTPHRLSDEALYAVADRQDLVEFTCPAGTVLFIDSSSCFHFGSRDALTRRHMMMYAYVSVSRCDFGDLLRPESPGPVPDAQSDLIRMKYPVRPGSSRLHSLVADPWFIDGDCCRRRAVVPVREINPGGTRAVMSGVSVAPAPAARP
jgi:hypothetical protein